MNSNGLMRLPVYSTGLDTTTQPYLPLLTISWTSNDPKYIKYSAENYDYVELLGARRSDAAQKYLKGHPDRLIERCNAFVSELYGLSQLDHGTFLSYVSWIEPGGDFTDLPRCCQRSQCVEADM